MNRRTRDLDSLKTMVQSDGKKFVRLDEGAALYSISPGSRRPWLRSWSWRLRSKRIWMSW